MAGDPVKLGLVASLNRPGGNVTGSAVYLAGLEQKRLGLLRKLVPKATTIALLINPKNPDAQAQTKDVLAAAAVLGERIIAFKASDESELETAFSALAEQRADALVVTVDPFFNSRREILVRLARRYAVPTIYDHQDTVTAGGLMSYGTSFAILIAKRASIPAISSMAPNRLICPSSSHEFRVSQHQDCQGARHHFPDELLAVADEVIE